MSGSCDENLFALTHEILKWEWAHTRGSEEAFDEACQGWSDAVGEGADPMKPFPGEAFELGADYGIQPVVVNCSAMELMLIGWPDHLLARGLAALGYPPLGKAQFPGLEFILGRRIAAGNTLRSGIGPWRAGAHLCRGL